MAFARFIAQIIRLRAHFPDYAIKKVRLDNAGEFTSAAFNDFCMSVGIDVEHPVPHVHTQNGMAESLIKRLQLIARPLILRTKLPITVWGHAILHAGALVQVRPSAYNKFSPIQLAFGNMPNISHLRVFGCAVYIPIAPPQRSKMGPQRRLGIYVGHFDENEFPALGGGSRESPNDITKWCTHSLAYLDPPSNQREVEVQKIIHMQRLANQLPMSSDTKRVTKSYIPAANAPSKIEVPHEHFDVNRASEPVPDEPKCLEDISEQVLVEPDKEVRQDDEPETEKFEISISFAQSGKIWARSEIDDDGMFSFSVAKEIDHENDDPDPTSVSECQKRPDWEKWQMAMKNEIFSLNKRTVVQWSIDRLMLTRIHFDLLKILKNVRSEVPYMSAIGALMYLANCTTSDIAFATNLLARYSSSPTRRHWNGIKHIFRYLQDAGYLSDPHKARSQTGYVFTYGGTAISGVPKNKLWLQRLQIMRKSLLSMKHAESVYG
ncbi:unnamed protein product [Microthlaspi erraticum]|uniref:Integrase catalytic domain-containing protein n=1 Tax=Microthlaspi erraticum TaxID=1685480 RepID=A0A6D2K1L0_9BRAS|nr:unnamed protein product [Microthlaspi erraticum]